MVPIIDDIVLFVFNDSEYGKGGMDWRFGKITVVKGAQICCHTASVLHLRGSLLNTGYSNSSRFLQKSSSLCLSILCCYNSDTLGAKKENPHKRLLK